MFAKRVLGSIIFLLVIAFALCLQSWVFAFLCAVLSALAMFEFNKMLVDKFAFDMPDIYNVYSSRFRLCFSLIASSGAAICAISIGYGWQSLLPFVMIVSFAAMMVFVIKISLPPHSAFFCFAGLVYFALGFGSLLAIRFYDTWHIVAYAFILSVGTDVGAYIFGSLLGKHKMSPRISPKKSWEGAFGGIIIAIIAAFVFNHFFGNLSACFVLVTSILGSIFAQAGDLFESYIKRWTGVKDSGHLIPGHGGIFDRFDSMMTLAPFLYACFYLYPL